MFNKNLELIWAQSSNGVIGQKGTMPWHIKEDLKYFTKMTVGKSVIMGRKTWDSLYIKPLPNRQNIVLSSAFFNAPTVVNSVDEALKKAEHTPIVIGGKKTYDLFMKYAKTLFVTVIDKKFDGDTYAPEISKKFKLIDNKILYTENKIKLEFRTY